MAGTTSTLAGPGEGRGITLPYEHLLRQGDDSPSCYADGSRRFSTDTPHRPPAIFLEAGK